MNPGQLWAQVDDYFQEKVVGHDEEFDRVLQKSAEAGLPAINVSPAQGKFLHLLARIRGAVSVLEVGTLAGYSTLWLARALPEGGRVVTLELDPNYAKIALRNFVEAGLAHMIDVRVGPAIQSLPELFREGRGPFDVIFIDADKASTPDYFTWALKLAKVGSVIVVDNVVRNGAVADATTTDPHVQGIRRFCAMLEAEPRVSATALQTVGVKGYDGFALVVVTGDAPRG